MCYCAISDGSGDLSVLLPPEVAKGSRRIVAIVVNTFDGLSFGQDGDGAFCHLFLVQNWGDFGAPAVWTHPNEMTCLIGLLCCLKEPPLRQKGRVRPHNAAPSLSCVFICIHIYSIAHTVTYCITSERLFLLNKTYSWHTADYMTYSILSMGKFALKHFRRHVKPP